MSFSQVYSRFEAWVLGLVETYRDPELRRATTHLSEDNVSAIWYGYCEGKTRKEILSLFRNAILKSDFGRYGDDAAAREEELGQWIDEFANTS